MRSLDAGEKAAVEEFMNKAVVDETAVSVIGNLLSVTWETSDEYGCRDGSTTMILEIVSVEKE